MEENRIKQIKNRGNGSKWKETEIKNRGADKMDERDNKKQNRPRSGNLYFNR